MPRFILGLTAATLATGIAVFLWLRTQPQPMETGEKPVIAQSFAYETVPVEAGGTVFMAEIADTDEKRSLGLGERDALCASCAMLFTFDAPGAYGFWMMGMRFPLDILWLREGRIVHIERHLQPGDLTLRQPPEAADSVLEVNAGTAERLGLERGGPVTVQP